MSQKNKGCRFHSDCDSIDTLSRGIYGRDATHIPYPDSEEIQKLKARIAELEEKITKLESNKGQTYHSHEDSMNDITGPAGQG